jgi:hypothetical protein
MQRKIGVDDFRGAGELMLQLVQPWRLGPELWWVCDEYELRRGKIVARFDEKHSEKWTNYKPLVDTPDLFLKFARLHEEPDFGEAARRFSHNYGLLHSRWQQWQDLSEFRSETTDAWIVLKMYEAALSGSAPAAESLVLKGLDVDSPLNSTLKDLFELYEALFPEYTGQTRYHDFAVKAAILLVNSKVGERCYLTLGFEDLALPLDPHKIRSAVGFDNLLGAMYLQMYWLMCSGDDLARCEYCGRIISLSRPYPEGRKRRRDKKFCNDACRQARHRSKKQASDIHF